MGVRRCGIHLLNRGQLACNRGIGHRFDMGDSVDGARELRTRRGGLAGNVVGKNICKVAGLTLLELGATKLMGEYLTLRYCAMLIAILTTHRA